MRELGVHLPQLRLYGRGVDVGHGVGHGGPRGWQQHLAKLLDILNTNIGLVSGVPGVVVQVGGHVNQPGLLTDLHQPQCSLCISLK